MLKEMVPKPVLEKVIQQLNSLYDQVTEEFSTVEEFKLEVLFEMVKQLKISEHKDQKILDNLVDEISKLEVSISQR